jgi:hypothetical protein
MLPVNQTSNSIVFRYEDVVRLYIGVSEDGLIKVLALWYKMRSHTQITLQRLCVNPGVLFLILKCFSVLSVERIPRLPILTYPG